MTAKSPVSPSSGSRELVYGFLSLSLAVLLYGSYLVPMRRADPRDGMFFQWVMCAAVWSTAKLGDLLLGSPPAPPLALLGGVAWATGNMAVVPTVEAVGLGLCVLLSGSSSLLMGWASSRFGWFGVSPEEVSRPLLNYCGAGLCLVSGVIFFFVKTNVAAESADSSPLLPTNGTVPPALSPPVDCTFSSPPPPRGFLLAVASGLLYGSSFVPVLYIKEHALLNGSAYHGASTHDVDYVYAQCSGVFLTSTVYFLIYCIVKRNRPHVLPSLVLPALLCGVMWTLGTFCWFLASSFLSAVVTFPILSAGYGLVAALWGSLVFKEVTVRTFHSVSFCCLCL
uniref:Transmembrane protein 144 n=1 Tax=Gadus morhua TaxID=8049 RepID=A0A8C5F694_GADMO